MSQAYDASAFEPPPEAEAFYAESLKLLSESGIPFLLSGTYAVTAYTGISRPTKDLDVFCKAGDYPKILAFFQERGYRTDVEDERWIAKVWQDNHFFDVIFAMSNGTAPITEEWFHENGEIEVYGSKAKITPPTELILSKLFIQDRYRFDGADVAHVILRAHDKIDWPHLMRYTEPYWEVLLSHLINFRFIYPTERDVIPRWVMDELTSRLHAQVGLPPARVRVCRGRLFSPRDYVTDITEWGFADVVGKGLEERHEPIA
ncbi:nucleotidyltransferase family protein [Phenylobacterium deserti]|uniref:Nucleotidyltransferase family protein n=1 Tax=Phenylobacterium deserti TaxID=1914756 RepID=A0A328AHJ0_9CAUL|nr:nucleotidyltransferase [Phenylobacterium deserti]RAK52824.1 hypothetical protein DJ018_11615 [Phenylobacterium deserti]